MQLADSRMESPISSYSKYRSQHKTNALLNRLNNDSGYPQDIFSTYTPSKNKDYLNLNKKNLKNFYSDRIQKQETSIFALKQLETIDPARIFQIRKEQYQLKSKTKMYLDSTIHVNPQTNKQGNIRKISEIFAINDKNRELKQAFGENRTKSHSFYDPINYRRGTSSFAQKKKSLSKKQAYQKVFGPDISSISKSQACQKIKSQVISNYNTIALKKVPQNSRKSHSKQFKRLISQMKGHYEQFNTNGSAKLNNIELTQNNEAIQRVKARSNKDVITHIQKFSQSCAKNLENFDRIKLRQIQDLQKIDSNFYQKMNQHKRKRLNSRMLYLDNAILNENYHRIVNNQVDDPQHSSQYSLTDANDANEQDIRPQALLVILTEKVFKKTQTTRDKFLWFGSKLLVALLKQKLYGIKKQNIYDAFWSVAQPYQKEGSYAFFKAVKIGDPEPVQIFLRRSQQYLFQKDDKGRGPLIIAIRYRNLEMIKMILEQGVNVDAECYARKKALYYAIQSKDHLIVKMILQFGAQPWSTIACDYKQLVSSSTNQIKLLMKNAKRLRIGLQLCKYRDKQSFWLSNRHLIDEKQLIFT